MYFKKLCSSFIFTLFLSSLTSQNNTSVEGKIYDAGSMKIISGANIRIAENNIGTSSNQNGFYSLNVANIDKITISVSHLGYQTALKKVDLKKGQENTLHFFLMDSMLTSETVDIVAHQSLEFKDKVQRTHTLKAKEISIAPVTSVHQMMDYTSGVISSNTTGLFSNRTVVTMRGMPANDQGRTLVILDGMPLNKADGGSVNWNLLQKNQVSEINVIKGPGPAKYGSGAMGGVIEIISKRPEKKISGDVQLEYGTYNTASADMRLSGIIKNKNNPGTFYWLLNGNARNSDGYLTTPEIFHTIDDTIMIPSYLKEYAAGIKAGYDFGNNNIIELQTQFFDDKRGNGVQVFDDFGAFSKHTTLTTMARYKGMRKFLKWQINLFNNTENYFRVYEYMKEQEYKLYEADAIRQDMGLQTDFDIYKIKNHKISAGFQAKKGSVSGNDTYYTSTDIIHNSGKMDIMAVYLQDEIKIIPEKVTANIGLRYDFAKFYDAHFSIDYPSYSIQFYENFETDAVSDKSWDAFSPRFSIHWQTTNNSRILFSAARGFRAPILDDMSRTGMRRGTFAIANPLLNPEFIDAFELSGDLLLAKKVYLSASAFYSIGSDFMYYISTGDSVNMGYRLAPIITKSNIGKVNIKGLETEIKYDINKVLSIFGNYTYTLAQIVEHQTKTAADSSLTGKHLTDIPNHKAVAGIRVFSKHVHSSIMAKYYGSTWINEYNSIEMEYFHSDKFDGYVTIDLRLEKQFLKYYQVAIQVENILNQKFIDGRQQQNPGRMLFVSGSFKF